MLNIFEFIKSYWSQFALLISIIGSIFLYFKNKPKRKQELQIGENQIMAGDIQNLSAIIKLQRDTIDDLRNDFDRLKLDYKERGKAYDKLEVKFEKISDTLKEYDRKLRVMYEENVELIRKVKQCSNCEIRHP